MQYMKTRQTLKPNTIKIISNAGIIIQVVGIIWWRIEPSVFGHLYVSTAIPNNPWLYASAPIPFALVVLVAAHRSSDPQLRLYWRRSLISLIVALALLLGMFLISAPWTGEQYQF